MEEYPIPSLMGSCSGVSEKALTCVEIINDLSLRIQATGVDGPDFSSGVRTLRDLGVIANGLKESLGRSPAVFVRLREAIAKLLTACHRGTNELHVHLQRLQPGNIDYLNVAFMQGYHELLESCNSLMTRFIEMLFTPEHEQYDSLNSREMRELILIAREAFDEAIEEHNIFRDQYRIMNVDRARILPILQARQQPPSSHGTATAPPPYAREPEPLGARIRPGVARGLDSIRNSLGTMAANMNPRRRNRFATALCEAAAGGDLDQIQGFLILEANINGRNEHGKTPLQCAIMSDQEASVDLLIANGASTGGAGWSGMPPLFLAACHGSINVAEYLISTGARIDESSLCGQPYFVDVVRSNNVAGIRFLLTYGASPNSTNISQEAVVVYAVRQGNREVAEILLDFGANITVGDRMGRCLLDIALERYDTVMCNMLLRRWVDPNGTTLYRTPLLVRELKRRRLRLFRLLIEGGADPDTQDNVPQPVIVTVIRDARIHANEKSALVRLLIRHGAEVANLEDTHKILRHAVATGIPQLVDLLLRKGVNPVCKMKSGETGLQYSFRKNKREMMLVFLKHRADPNFADKQGMTPLMRALLQKDVVMIAMLRQAGAEMSSDLEAFARGMGSAEILDALRTDTESRILKIRRWSL